MEALNCTIDTKNNQLKYIPGHASEIKTDAEYIEAAASALASIEAIAEQLHAFTDDFDIRVAYNKLLSVRANLQVKIERAPLL